MTEEDFYRNYEEYVPGPVVRKTEEILKVIKEKDWKEEKRQAFYEESYAYTDGNSTKRVVEFVVKKDKK